MTGSSLRRPLSVFALFCAASSLSLPLAAQANPSFPPDAQEPSARKPELPVVTAKQQTKAEIAYLAGAKLLHDGKFAAAESRFGEAVKLDPVRPEYIAALALAREHRVTDLLQQSAQQRTLHPEAADRLLDQARTLDSTNPRVQQHTSVAGAITAPAPVRTLLATAIRLQHNNTRHSYHLRGDTRSLLQQFAHDYGFTAAFDADLKTSTVRVDADDLSYDDALSILTLLTRTMLVPLDEHTALVANDTTENHTRLDRLEQETFYLPGYTADQMKDFVSIAQTIFDIKQVVAEPLHGEVVVRGPAETLDAVERVFSDLLSSTTDVVLDIKLYEVDKQHVRNLGIILPQSVSSFSVAAEAQSIVNNNSSLVSQLVSSGVLPSTTSTLQIAEYLVLSGLVSDSIISNAFVIFGGGATTAGVSIGNSPTLNLALSQSEARTLDDTQLRASDRERAIFKVGTRYPIQTSIYSDIATSTAASTATVNGVSLSSLLAQYLGTSSTTATSAIIPQVQYEDLGLSVDATPRIQHNGDVGMHLEVKVSALAGTALNGIPILDSRQFSSDLTVRDGETVMMISNVTDQQINAVTGAPGLSEVPGFQSTTNEDSTRITGDLVLMITPHVVQLGHSTGKGPYIPLHTRPDND